MQRFLFLFLLLGPAAMGQATDSARTSGIPPQSNYKYSIIHGVGATLALTSTPNMQAFFRQNSIKRDSPLDPFVYGNFGGRYKRLKLLFDGGYGVNLFQPNEKDARVVRRTYALSGGATLGYDVLNTRNRRLYLNVGVGQLNYEYAVINRTTQPVVFQNQPQYNPAGNIPSLQFRNDYWDINVEFSQREKRSRSIANVFRVGYRRGWQANAWRSGAFSLLEAPQDRISQFYFQAGLYVSGNYWANQ
ncbi:hypothetical protein [Hymenobacter arizonensis]|uniref:Outer membrane protein beta-barrel domain-containing protein n=1 Tax=Hymenobacter arizonensis TaxID=1227077 RepID=A0A1I6BQP4_HYMAR|nr:hypothetical protein [Hymenobacter arizonensis]SFQ83256.1 hypothetical protein SAMN04515668_4935 [Hymenobacter arizonensis]